MAARKILTVAGIRAARAQAKKERRERWMADGAVPRTHGGLQLYVNPRGNPRWYWRYTKPDGSTPRIPLGAYTEKKAQGALTITEAREEVTRKAALYQRPETRDVRAHLAREAARATAEQTAAEREHLAALADKAAAGQYTLERLFGCYVAHLRKQGKSSAAANENAFALHVKKAHPITAALPANAIEPRDGVAILRRITEAGKGRTAAKLRSYLRAAYALAERAALDSSVPAAFLPFNVKSNPFQATAALAQFNRVLDRALSEPELREYWTSLHAAPDSPVRDALLLLGTRRAAAGATGTRYRRRC